MGRLAAFMEGPLGRDLGDCGRVALLRSSEVTCLVAGSVPGIGEQGIKVTFLSSARDL